MILTLGMISPNVSSDSSLLQFVTLQIKQNYETTFPAVTVCNMNPIKSSALGELDLAKKRRRKRYAGIVDL